MQYSTLIAQIEADIYSNGAELITGDILQTVLKRMVSAWASAGAAYGGTISPDTVVPLSLDQATVYLALTAGTYEHFLDGDGDPIETTGPALVIYDGGPALIFTKTDLPSGGSGATVITASFGDSLVIKLPKAAEGIKGSYRIDMTAAVYGGDVDARYIGSLIIECNDLAMQTAHGYYYGDAINSILSEVALWKDDPEFYPDEQNYYLLLTTNANLNEIIFSVSPLDDQPVDAFAANEDEMVKVADATITPVGSGGGDGKMGVISQTQTWSGTPSTGYDYTMTNVVMGVIPQASIDLFEAAGATFNTSTGYFEMNGLTDISYGEMVNIYENGRAIYPLRRYAYYSSNMRTTIPFDSPLSYNFATAVGCGGLFYFNTNIEVIRMTDESGYNNVANIPAASDFASAFSGATRLRDASYWTCASGFNYTFDSCYCLERIFLRGANQNLSIKNSPRLTAASVAYMITNAGTATITITLHATAYARAIADADVQAALAAHTNVSLQRA